MASLEEIIAQISEEDYLHDPIQFIIDSDLRIVSIPGRGVVAGVVGDKNINRINFQMNRYYNGFDMSKFTTRITNAEKSVMNYAKNEAVDSMNQSAKNITTENITKIQNEGSSERQKISQKGTEMIADLKRKLYFTDESSGKTYVGELKIINGKPSLEYKESV